MDYLRCFRTKVIYNLKCDVDRYRTVFLMKLQPCHANSDPGIVTPILSEFDQYGDGPDPEGNER